MLPTIRQQLESMKLRLEETILPEIPESSKFAREQAAFVLTTLNWLIDTHEHQYRYEVIENQEFRRTLKEMRSSYSPAQADDALLESIATVLAEAAPSPSDSAIPIRTLIDQNRRMKQLAATLYEKVAKRAGSRNNPTRAAFCRAAIRQGEREIAYFRMTGFVNAKKDLETVLAEQANDVLPR